MKKDFSEPFEKNFYHRLKPVAKAVLHLCYNITCVGKENIPESGGFIIAANHISFFDPVMIMAYCPRVCHFMAKSDLFERPIFGSFIRNMNAFPVKRGTSDKHALNFAKKIIDNGWVMGIFPEGTRSKNLKPQRPKNGVAYLAKKTKADVLPVSIHKNREKKLRPKVVVRFGEVIKNEEFGFESKYDQQQLRFVSQMIMKKITALWSLDEKKDGDADEN